MNDIHKNDLGERITRISHKMLDTVDVVLDKLTPAPEAARPPLAVARRQVANLLGLWQLCANRACRRSRCCRGEPSECLRYALPLLPPDMVAGLMRKRNRGRRRR